MVRSLGCGLVSIAVFAVACGDDGGGAAGGGTGASAQSSTASGPGASVSSSGASGTSASSTGSGGEAGGPPAGTPVLVAVGYGGRRVSTADGFVFENDIIVDPNGGDDDNLFRGVGWGDGVFVAVGGAAAGQIATSSDGASWTFGDPQSSWVGDVAFQNGIFVAAGGNGLRIRSTDAGATWGDDTGYYAGHYRGIAAGNGVFVAAGHTYGNSTVGLVSTTTDGVAWTPEQTGGAGYGSIAFGAGVFVAVGGDRCSVSPDGIAWADCTISATEFGRVIFGDDRFAMMTNAGIFTSADGASWQPQSSTGGPQGLMGYGLARWFGGSWPDTLFNSADLADWEMVYGDGSPAFVDAQLGYVR